MTAFGAARFVRAASSNLSGLVKYFRNTDLVYTATREVELAIWRRDHVANYAPTLSTHTPGPFLSTALI